MGAMVTEAPADRDIVFRNVSKFYGEVLGVNRVDLSIPPGITSLVGPNGSGKTTMMNLMTGLLRPTEGSVSVLGIPPDQPERLSREVGYCTQYDSFPPGLTGFQFLVSYLRFHGYEEGTCREMAEEALEKVSLSAAASRKVAAYSKGMRQRVKLAHAIAHGPSVLVLDEPLNGLDPMGRAEMIEIFQELASRGLHVIISSHILHEVDLISDRVVLLHEGYVVAEGDIRGVRGEMRNHPLQILVRCDRPWMLASRAFQEDHVAEVRIHDDRRGLQVSTHDPDRFYLLLNRAVTEDGLEVEAVAPVDESVQAVYDYLIGTGGE